MRRILLIVLLVLNLSSRLLLATRPLEKIDGVLIPDDAYLSLSLARSMAEGHGPAYGGEPTNGFQPLYVFMMVPAYLAIPHDPVAPVHVALVVLSIFDTLTLYLLLRLLRHRCVSLLARAVAAVAWVANPYVITNSVNGLETAVACFLVVASIYWFHRRFQQADRTPTHGDSLCLGLLLGLATFARIDNAILAACIGFVLVTGARRQGSPAGRLLRNIGFIALGALLAYAPWALYSYAYTGDLYPVSGRAVRFMSLAAVDHAPTFVNWYWPMLKSGLLVVLARNQAYLGIAAIALLATRLMRSAPDKQLLRERKQLLAVPLLFSGLLFLSYTLYIFAHWFFSRYLYPISITLFLIMAFGVDMLLSTLVTRARRIGAACCASLLIVAADSAGLMRIFMPRNARSDGYMNVGLWAAKSFEDGTIIGSSQTGALGYFAPNLEVVNLDGVVNRRCLESLEARRNMDYIRERKIEYVLGWQVNLGFIADHSTGFREEDLVVLRRLDELRSWSNAWYLARVQNALATPP